ncbi:mandelate racemase/muconate lactonizing enzyme family protein [Microbacterium sp. ZW T5_56]|uniref:mandelate racemase/muconate lactonizing enzyme family protein n=1 Tax=Microbacterium sp. ZW T5_56 TaxID=3378081 RepID=UPI003853C039
MSSIADIRVRPVSYRMPRPWVPTAPDMHLVLVEVVDTDGATGTGFSWTPTIGVSAVAALLRDDIRSFALGRGTDPQELWPELWVHLHEAGGGGVTTIAMAGLDLALWDLAARRQGTGVAGLIGRRHESLPLYGSGVNLHYTDDELRAQARRWADAGYPTAKAKVGHADTTEDLRRMRLIRDELGADRRLMIDANQRWSLDRAERALDVLGELDPAWVEEPLRADDIAGYRELRRRTDLPIAMGENLHTVHRFREAIDAGVDVLQPNVVRVGGITPFREIAAECAAAGVTLAPHLLPDLSTQVAMTLDTEVWIEDVEDAWLGDLGALVGPGPVRRDAERVTVDDRPGLGFHWRIPPLSHTTLPS